jgi:hypothetical protein
MSSFVLSGQTPPYPGSAVGCAQSVATEDSLIRAFEDLLEAVELANADAVQVRFARGSRRLRGFPHACEGCWAPLVSAEVHHRLN